MLYVRTYFIKKPAGGHHYSQQALENPYLSQLQPQSSLTRYLIIHIRRVLKCGSTQDGYTSPMLLLAVAVHKLLLPITIIVGLHT